MPISDPEAGRPDASASPSAVMIRSDRATAILPSNPIERSPEIGTKTMRHGSEVKQLDEGTRLVQGKRRRKVLGPSGMRSCRRGAGGNNGESAVWLAGRAHGNLNIVTQSREELHEAPNRKVAGAVPHQQGYLRLLHA